jgi:hypothetical protein
VSCEAAELSNAAKTNAANVRVALPYHLCKLARVEGDVLLEVNAPVTLRAVLDALEVRYPMLRGTIREYETGQRRAFLRFLFARKTGRWNRRTRRCPTLWLREKSLC